MLRCAAAAGLLGAALWTSPIPAQDSLPVVVVDQEQLLEASKAGRAFIAAQEARTQVLLKERQEIESQLIAEEEELARLRVDLEPDAFRELAEAFDEKARAARIAQDERAQDASRQFEADRKRFFDQVRPVMFEIMQRYGAGVVLDSRSVLFADPSLDVSGDVISRLDEIYEERLK